VVFLELQIVDLLVFEMGTMLIS